MASAKRERQRANRADKQARLAEQAELEAKLVPEEPRSFRKEFSHSFAKDKLQRRAGGAILALFAYNITAKSGLVPSARHHLPEALDVMDHIGNVAWTMLLLSDQKRLGYARAEKRFMRDTIDKAYDGEPTRPGLAFVGRAMMIGAGLNLAVEGVTQLLPEVAQRITGGFDPLDVAYGVGTAVVASTYQAVKTHNAVDGVEVA